jgi:hypothetical protein
VHSDVGGGYPQDGLSYVTLDWMLDRAKAYGLRYFDKQRDLLIDPQINPADKLNDSRKGLAGYYRYKPRNILETYSAPPYKPSFASDIRQIWRLIVNDFRRLLGKTPDPDPQTEILADLHPTMRAPEGEATDVLPVPKATFHEAVFNRIKTGTDRYAPVVMPASYYGTDKAGNVVDALHPIDPGEPRSKVQDDVWNWIWLRRVVYFLTIFATLFIAAIPFWVIYAPGFGRSSVGGFVIPIVPGTVVCGLSQRPGLGAGGRDRGCGVDDRRRQSAADHSRRRARRVAFACDSQQFSDRLARLRVLAAQAGHLPSDVLHS